MINDFHKREEATYGTTLSCSEPLQNISGQALGDILELASSVCNTPNAVLNLVDEKGRWSAIGRDGSFVSVSPLLNTLNEYTLLQEEVFMVGDMRKDRRFFHVSTAPSDTSFRFYAGISLRKRNGQAIGSLSVTDTKPRMLRAPQKKALRILAQHIIQHCEMSQKVAQLNQDFANCEEEATKHGQMQERMLSQVARLTALRAIDVSILSGMDLKQTLHIVLNQVLALLHADAASILLFDIQTQMLECGVECGFKTTCSPLPPIRVGRGLVGRAVLEGDPTPRWNIEADDEDCERAEIMQIEGLADYYVVPLIARGSCIGAIEIFHRESLSISPDWIDFLMSLAGQAAIAIENVALFRELQQSNKDLMQAYDTTIEGWSRALDLRDRETLGHSKRVTEMTLRLAGKLGVSEEELVHLRRGALLHDIGKMGVPDNILLKSGPLTDDEWKLMRQHPVFAYEMLSPIAFLRPALDIPYYHHEKWDGSGYPHGLKKKQIPLAARIFAVIDVWDALCSDRPYRQGWPEEKVWRHLRSLSGTHFDPAVVSAFLSLEEVYTRKAS